MLKLPLLSVEDKESMSKDGDSGGYILVNQTLACETKDYPLAIVEANPMSSHIIQPGAKADESFESLGETSKKGLCWFELKRAGLAQWGACRQVKFMGPQVESIRQSSSVGREFEKVDGEALKASIRKRKCLPTNQLREGKAIRHGIQRQNGSHNKCKGNKLNIAVQRWSAQRYKLAEESMLKIMKAEGAVFENPISRPALRLAARKLIGDTGLLDHLLKHIDGKVAPGGTERFRRCYNTSGVMEYWLESADLVHKQRETGMLDANRIIPSWLKSGGCTSEDSAYAGELKVLKEEMAKMKSEMQEMLSKKQEQDNSHTVEEIHKEWMKWKANTDQKLMEISNSLSCMQFMFKEFGIWKARVDQQLIEISNSMGNLQASKQCTSLSPSASEKWDDWLESSDMDIFQGGHFAPWLESTCSADIGQGTAVLDPSLVPLTCSKPVNSQNQGLQREEMAIVKRDMHEIVPWRQEEDQANLTPVPSI